MNFAYIFVQNCSNILIAIFSTYPPWNVQIGPNPNIAVFISIPWWILPILNKNKLDWLWPPAQCSLFPILTSKFDNSSSKYVFFCLWPNDHIFPLVSLTRPSPINDVNSKSSKPYFVVVIKAIFLKNYLTKPYGAKNLNNSVLIFPAFRLDRNANFWCHTAIPSK